MGHGEALLVLPGAGVRGTHLTREQRDPPLPCTPTGPLDDIARLDFRITVIPALAAPGLFNTAFRRWRSRLLGSDCQHRRNAYCFDRVIVVHEAHARRLLREYLAHYHDDRTHLGLNKDSPRGRPMDPHPGPGAQITAHPRMGGLHHRYAWKRAA